MPSVLELTRSSSLIFSGTVAEHGTSKVSAVPPNESLVVVRVDRGLRVDPVLGDLRGRLITMASGSPGDLKPGQKAVFFTRSWIHGKEIAAHEIAHVDVQSENEVAAAVQSLPDMHLKDRLQTAQLVVLAEVSEVRDVANQTRERRAPHWSVAVLRVVSALKGDAETVRVFFPTSESHYWIRAPRFQPNQRGLYLLHSGEPSATRWLDPQTAGAGAMTALDPADFQPESRLEEIKSFLTGRQ